MASKTRVVKSVPISGPMFAHTESKDEDTPTVIGPMTPATFPELKLSPLMLGFFGKGARTLRTRLGLAGSMTTSGTGAVNSSILNGSLAATTEFVAFAAVFDEFFIHDIHTKFVPFNQFMTNPSCSLPSGLYATGMLIGAPLYHGAATYASASVMLNNPDAKVLSTASPFSMDWHNNESPKSTVATSSSTSSPVATQSWCLTSATSAALYAGALQFRTHTPLANVISTTIGDFAIVYDVSFRARA